MQRESIAKILLFNERNQVLFLRVGIHKLRPERSHVPDLPGGIVDPGESEFQAVIREVSEETNIVIGANDVTLGYANTTFYAAENKSVTRLLYTAKLNYTPVVTLSWEHEAYEWCDSDVLFGERGLAGVYRDGVSYLKDNRLI